MFDLDLTESPLGTVRFDVIDARSKNTRSQCVPAPFTVNEHPNLSIDRLLARYLSSSPCLRPPLMYPILICYAVNGELGATDKGKKEKEIIVSDRLVHSKFSFLLVGPAGFRCNRVCVLKIVEM